MEPIITTHVVPVRRDIVDDPYSDLSEVIERYALMQAQVGINGTRPSEWKVIDWAGPILDGANEAPGIVYYRAIVQETPTRKVETHVPPIACIHIPMAEELIDGDVFDLAGFINRHAKDAARVAWEARNPPALTYHVVDWAGPFEYMYMPGDLPPSAKCFRAYVEVNG